MINVSDLVVVFGAGTPLEKRALNGVDLTIERGEFVCVIGSNGSGKSTLLNSIAGDFPPAKGKIKINGNDVTSWPTARRTGLVARVFQDPLAGSCADLTIETLPSQPPEERGAVSGWRCRRNVDSNFASVSVN